MFYRPRCSASLAISALTILAVLPARAQTAPAAGAGSPEAAVARGATAAPVGSTAADYRIRPGDVLNINVWDMTTSR
jgi:protein involved in polysaccharide export with SLBB domain